MHRLLILYCDYTAGPKDCFDFLLRTHLPNLQKIIASAPRCISLLRYPLLIIVPPAPLKLLACAPEKLIMTPWQRISICWQIKLIAPPSLFAFSLVNQIARETSNELFLDEASQGIRFRLNFPFAISVKATEDSYFTNDCSFPLLRAKAKPKLASRNSNSPSIIRGFDLGVSDRSSSLFYSVSTPLHE